MKEAAYYHQLDNKIVQCDLCPNFCVIKPDHNGKCLVRSNINGTLYSMIYNKVSSMAVDPIQKKPLFHYYPGSKIFSIGSLGCNLRCKHCQNYHISQIDRKSAQKTADTLTFDNALTMAKEHGCSILALTYNEPMIWFEYAIEGLKKAKNEGFKVVYVTNGYVNQKPFEELAPYIDAMSIDLKGFSDKSYVALTGINGFKPVTSLIKWIKDNSLIHLELVSNLVTSINDDMDELKLMANWIYSELGDRTPWHITSFRPKLDLVHLPPTPLKTIDAAVKIGKEAGLKYVYTGNLIYNEHENTYCPTCNEIVVHRVDFDVVAKNYTNGKCNHCKAPIDIIDG